MNAPWLRPTADGVELRLLVQPRASRDEVVGIQGEELKVRLTAPPVDGAANAACCNFFARLCKVPRGCVILTAGETSRHKRLLLRGVDPVAVAALLASRTGG